MSYRLSDQAMRVLQDEAHAISTALGEAVQRRFAEASSRAAVWQPGPMPADWTGQPERRNQ